jgi:acetyltransferase-like isoleucine patch superfamily enzyme
MLKFIKISTIPFCQLLFIIFFKYIFIGKFKPRHSSVDESGQYVEQNGDSWYRLKHLIMKKLLPDGTLCGATSLVGSHYEIISLIYRLLGAKIGKRVYWPGSGLNIVEHDLLTIDDDVVFGSRSLLMTSSAHHSAPIVLHSGSMIADRCVVLPGVVVGEHAVLGSGALACADSHCRKCVGWQRQRQCCCDRQRRPEYGRQTFPVAIWKGLLSSGRRLFCVPFESHCCVLLILLELRSCVAFSPHSYVSLLCGAGQQK